MLAGFLRVSIRSKSIGAVLTLALLLQGCGGGGSPGPDAPAPLPPPPVSRDELLAASRFSAAATFGLSYAEIEAMARSGNEAWLEAQFAQPVTLHVPIVDQLVLRREAGEFAEFEDDIELLTRFRRFAWWHRAVTANDALRQRVAYALSQIFIVSDNVDALVINPYALSSYYDMLLSNSFGNFRNLLRDVALHPSMGIYLSHANNQKSNSAANTFPDENFAREVMQLFSIGLFRLNIDGSQSLDGEGNPQPTYTNVEIRQFARIFTGFSYGGPGAHFGNGEPNFRAPMRMFDEFHEPGPKNLLDGHVVPPGQSGEQDFEEAIDVLFNHPNVGPFIGRQLIQRLTTSNPSAAYVERVALAFNDNGSGVRGDLQAVIRAVLLDLEANNAPDVNSTFGKLREPVVRYTSALRQFNATSQDGFIFNSGYYLQILARQHPLSAPSVFNFYSPNHLPPGALADAGLISPELEITTSTSIVGLSNLIDAVIVSDYVTDAETPFEKATLDIDEYVAIAADIPALMDRLDLLLTYGTLNAETRRAIEGVLEELDDPGLRVRFAIYLMLISPDYAVQI